MSFDSFSLDTRIRAGIQSAGYTVPTPIQKQAIPPILTGRDLIGIAQTGTGKTAAFMLPILQRLTTHAGRGVRTLILAPTRELAEQTHQATRQLGGRTRVRSVSIYGGVSKKRQVDALRRGVDVVVACPGRLLDLAGDRSINLSKVEVLVLDEADRMCDMGFLPDIRRIIKLLPTRRQTLFFSATMPDDIRKLADSILHDPVTVQVGIIAPPKTISHALYPIAGGLKKQLLLAMLERRATGRALIFTRTKHRARGLASDLAKKGYRVSALQGNMTQNRRQSAIDGFRKGRYDILVATDVASRGIDVADINHVINYDMPDTADAYTHRVGRTGRIHKAGDAMTLALPQDEGMVQRIERVLGKSLERRRLPDFNYGTFNPETRPKSNGSGKARPAPSNGNGRRPSNSRRRPNRAGQRP
ncbi:MAG: DEAD/DEAH box helicase, partial [Hyphomicrobiaceae bacterium]|nr:DEAD/DEAH box helicase [Hyphomicrobiaceae bacterium]